MGWFQRFREAYSKEATEDSAKGAWRWTKWGLRAIGAAVLLALWHWLPRLWANGLIVGAVIGFCVVVLVVLSGRVADKVQERRRRPAVAPYVNVAFVRQLHINYFAPSIKSATSYLGWLCEQAGSMPPLGPLLASLIWSDVLGPCSETMGLVGRQLTAAVPGKLPAEDFDKLRCGFADLASRYGRVAQWIGLVRKALGRQGSPEYDLLSRQHEAFVAELKKADGYVGLKEITRLHGTLEEQLPAQPPADPPSPKASG